MIIPDSGDGNHKDDAFVLFFILKELIIPDSGDGNEQRIKDNPRLRGRKRFMIVSSQLTLVKELIIPDSGDGNIGKFTGEPRKHRRN